MILPLISVIVCSVHPPEWERHQRNVERTIGVDYEYIRIDNRGNPYSLAGAYNEGIRRSKGDLLVFVHEDVFFLEMGWGRILQEKFSHSDLSGIGVAGSQVLLPEQPSWVSAGRPWIKGRVLHQDPQTQKLTLCHYSPESEQGDQRVVVLDGLFMSFRRSVCEQLQWDAEQFDGFHLYDMDFSLRASKLGEIRVTQDILLMHQSAGKFDQVWWSYAERFTIKHFNSLPALLDGQSWNGIKGERFESQDLTGRIDPQKVI